jgi:hypothetical protein
VVDGWRVQAASVSELRRIQRRVIGGCRIGGRLVEMIAICSAGILSTIPFSRCSCVVDDWKLDRSAP